MSSGRPVAATLWVGNLPFETTEAEMHGLLSQIGPIKNLRLIMDRETGKPKGFGFCEFFDKATAESAYRNLNNTDFKGRPLRLDYAEEEMTDRDRKARGGGGGRGDGGRPDRDGPPGGGPMRGGGGGGGGGPPIGYKAAATSAQQVAGLLGGAPASDMRIQEQLNELLASKSRPELWEVLRHLKEFLQADRATARHYFAERPGLAKAVFQAQVLLGMVKPLAPGFVPPGGYPPEGPMGMPGRLAGPGGPPPPPPRTAGGPMGLQVPAGAVLPQGPMTQVVVVDASGQQQTVMVPAGQLGALGMVQAAPSSQPGIALQPGAPVALAPGQQPGELLHALPPQQQQQLPQVQLQQQPLQQVQVGGLQPQQQPQPQQPQQQVQVGGVMQPMAQQQQQPPPQQPAGGLLAGQDPAQMQTLLRQVVTMSEEQINALPANFKQQVLYVKEQIRLGHVRVE